MPKFHSKASIVNTASKKAGSVVSVLASAGFTFPSKAPELATYGCKDCGTQFSAQAHLQPFCVTCGSEAIKPVEAATAQVLEEKQDLIGVVCSGCTTTNMMHATTAHVLNGHMHCVTCGEAISFEAPSVDPEEAVDVFNATEEGEEGDMTDPLDSVSKTTPATAKVVTAADGGADDELNPPLSADDPNTFTRPLEVQPVAMFDSDKVEVPLNVLEQQDLAGLKDDLVLASISDTRMIAFYQGMPCMESIRTASPHADAWDEGTIKRIVMAGVKGEGLNKSLEKAGFKPLKIKLDVAKLRESAKTAVTAGATETRDEVVASHMQCLAIAMAGLHKGFFKNRDNPLKAALYDELVAASVEHPARVVDKVFATQGGNFLSTVLEIATEMGKKSVDVRNELTAAIDCANYIPGMEGTEDTEDDCTEPALSRLEEQANLRIVHSNSDAPLKTGGKLFG